MSSENSSFTSTGARDCLTFLFYKGARVQQRWIFAVLACLATVNAYTMRMCLALAITEMVTVTKTSSSDTNLDTTCTTSTDLTSSSTNSSGTYEWDEYTQGIILSSFHVGYIITQLPGGILAEKFGGKYTLGLGILSTAVFSILTPIMVETFNSIGLIVLRVLMGICEGTTYPAISVLIAQWAPPLERSKITAVVMSGMAIGTVLANALSGVLIQYSSIGWPIVFYFYGALGIVWFCAWILFCYSSPDNHPFISETEKKYLQESTKKHTHKVTQPTPWLHILASSSFWALVAAKLGVSLGLNVMLSDLPKYMSNVLNFSIQANGFLTALPYVILGIIGTTSSWPADWLIKSERMSRTNVRKICHTIASVIPAIFIIAASYAGCDRTVVVILFAIGVGATGTHYITVMINPNDLSPNHTGVLMAVVNSVGSLTGVVAPYGVGILTPHQTLSEWRLVFWITFVLFVGTSVIFNIWGDGEVQYWNDLDSWKVQRSGVESKAQSDEDVSSPKLGEES